MNIPRISVIIPALNMGKFLRDAIASIQRQVLPIFEIIVVDNQSIDNTAEVLARLSKADLRIRVFEVEPNGPARARNKGLEVARGEVIVFLDADDLWPANKLAVQVPRLCRAPDVEIVSGFLTSFEVLDQNRLAPALGSRVETCFHIQLGTCLWRRSVFDRIGVFDEELIVAQDVDFFLRVLEERIPMAILTTSTLYFRRHNESWMMQNKTRLTLGMARAFARSLARRRRNGSIEELPKFESFYEVAEEAAS